MSSVGTTSLEALGEIEVTVCARLGLARVPLATAAAFALGILFWALAILYQGMVVKLVKDVPFCRDLEQRLTRALGTKVEVRDRGNKGEIAIPYADLDALDRILAKLL